MTRWPIIRHARWLLHAVAFQIWWNRVGSRLGVVPNPADIEHLKRIWRGES